MDFARARLRKERAWNSVRYEKLGKRLIIGSLRLEMHMKHRSNQALTLSLRQKWRRTTPNSKTRSSRGKITVKRLLNTFGGRHKR